MSSEEFDKKVKEFEGYADFMYLDTKGIVTIGVGININSLSTVKRLKHIFYNEKTGKAATEKEIEEAFNSIKKAPKGLNVKRYKQYTILQAKGEELELLLAKRKKDAWDDVRQFFPQTTNLPVVARYALFDMAFNLGRGNLLKFEKLRKALADNNLKAAAIESHRRGIQAERNQAIFTWFLEAEKIKTNAAKTTLH